MGFSRMVVVRVRAFGIVGRKRDLATRDQLCEKVVIKRRLAERLRDEMETAVRARCCPKKIVVNKLLPGRKTRQVSTKL
jgi:hypothetical protein